MVNILERIPSFGENLMNRFVEGFGKGLERSEKQRSARAKALQGQQKSISRASRDIPKFIKDFYPEHSHPEDLREIERLYSESLMRDENISEREAREQAIAEFQARRDSSEGNEQASFGSQFRGLTPPGGKKAPFEALRGDISNLFGAVKGGVQNPTVTAAKTISPLMGLFQPRTRETGRTAQGLATRNVEGEPWSQLMERAAGAERLSPEAQKQTDDAALLATLVPWGRLLRGLSSGSKAAEGLKALEGPRAAPQIGMASQEVGAAERSTIQEAAREMGLGERITQPPKTATELRMGRLNPSEKVSPVKQIVETRKKQLANYPKYSEEIARDAAEREVRRQARIPKTEVGEAGLAKRIAIAEQKIPALQNSYTKSLARVRALEDSLAKMPAELRQRYQNLYEIAKQELQEASTDLVTGMSNRVSGGTKSTVSDSVRAANKKLFEIEEAIEAGRDYPLKGYDYSPKMIEQAKAIQKHKPLPKMRGDDFYNQIHDRYLEPYKTKLSELNRNIRDPLAPPDILKNATKQKDILEKMIESAEAEKTIHNHKLGLREMQEAKMTDAKLRSLEKSPLKETKASKAAQESWRKQFQEAKSPQEKARVIDEGAAQAARESPATAEKIGQEAEQLKVKAQEAKSSFSGAMDEVNNAGNAQKAGETARGIFKNILEGFQRMGKDFPYIWASESGRDFLVGIGTGIMEDIIRENGIDLPYSASYISTLLTPKRAPMKLVGLGISKWAIRQWKIGRAEKSYHEHKMKEFESYSPSIKKKAKERIYGR